MGIVQKLKDKDTSNKTYCRVPPGSEFGIELKPLSLTDILGPFLILGAGYSAAIISFVFESTLRKLEKRVKINTVKQPNIN
ncbi:UNVERIFIED_CONTAM: hypothetical protein RMT77_001292 [Armadillidium vulgare]